MMNWFPSTVLLLAAISSGRSRRSAQEAFSTCGFAAMVHRSTYSGNSAPRRSRFIVWKICRRLLQNKRRHEGSGCMVVLNQFNDSSHHDAGLLGHCAADGGVDHRPMGVNHREYQTALP